MSVLRAVLASLGACGILVGLAKGAWLEHRYNNEASADV